MEKAFKTVSWAEVGEMPWHNIKELLVFGADCSLLSEEEILNQAKK